MKPVRFLSATFVFTAFAVLLYAFGGVFFTIRMLAIFAADRPDTGFVYLVLAFESLRRFVLCIYKLNVESTRIVDEVVSTRRNA